MKYLREFICHNQKQLIKYEYTISQLHKAFKDSYYEESQKLDNNKLQENYEKLIIDSFNMLEETYASNIKYIENVFNIDNSKVRITIKMLLEDKKSLIDIYRNHEVDNKFSQTSIKENFGFKEIILNQKTFYMNNDLEEAFLSGNYENNRIKEDCYEDLKHKKISWKDCWKGYNTESIKNNEYYQSTLIIPMSITNSEEDKEQYSLFYNQFFEPDKKFLKQRTIWGFLCIDTIEKNYFTKLENELISPVDYGFVFADILSLYLVFFYNYVISSETIKEYEDNLENTI